MRLIQMISIAYKVRIPILLCQCVILRIFKGVFTQDRLLQRFRCSIVTCRQILNRPQNVLETDFRPEISDMLQCPWVVVDPELDVLA